MISAIIFSKDRAMQTDLLLRSMQKNCGDLFSEIIVYYTSSEEEYQAGYNKLASSRPEVRFVKEVSFRDDVLALIAGMKNEFVCALSDDCIVFRDVTHKINKITNLLNSLEYVYSFIFGLGRECVYSGTLRKFFVQPPFVEHDELILWRWKEADLGEFSCPYMLAGNIYRKHQYLYHLQQVSFSNPSYMEEGLQITWQNHRKGEMLDFCASFPEQILVHSHNNRVQHIYCNPAGIEFGHEPRFLNTMYLTGHVVDLDNLAFVGINGLHKEINLTFRPE